MNRRTLIAASVVGVLGIILFWPDDEVPESPGNAVTPPAPPTSSMRQLEPAVNPWTRGYETAGPPQLPGRAPPTDYYRPYYPGNYPPAAEGRYRPLRPDALAHERFTFRPLSEREREKLEAERPDPYYDIPPSPQPYAGWGTTPERRDYRQTPAYPDWYGDGYSYRREERRPTRNDGPSGSESRWRDWEDYQAPWTAPSSPQWGSQPQDWYPPAERMYPSLNGNPGRRFTAR